MNLYFPTAHPKIQNTRKATFSYTYKIYYTYRLISPLMPFDRFRSVGKIYQFILSQNDWNLNF